MSRRHPWLHIVLLREVSQWGYNNVVRPDLTLAICLELARRFLLWGLHCLGATSVCYDTGSRTESLQSLNSVGSLLEIPRNTEFS